MVLWGVIGGLTGFATGFLMGGAGGFIVGGTVGVMDSVRTVFVSTVLHGNRLSAYDLFTTVTTWVYGGCQIGAWSLSVICAAGTCIYFACLMRKDGTGDEEA